jgi:hypothetical protein
MANEPTWSSDLYNEDDARCQQCGEWVCSHRIVKEYPDPKDVQG